MGILVTLGFGPQQRKRGWVMGTHDTRHKERHSEEGPRLSRAGRPSIQRAPCPSGARGGPRPLLLLLRPGSNELGARRQPSAVTWGERTLQGRARRGWGASTPSPPAPLLSSHANTMKMDQYPPPGHLPMKMDQYPLPAPPRPWVWTALDSEQLPASTFRTSGPAHGLLPEESTPGPDLIPRLAAQAPPPPPHHPEGLPRQRWMPDSAPSPRRLVGRGWGQLASSVL